MNFFTYGNRYDQRLQGMTDMQVFGNMQGLGSIQNYSSPNGWNNKDLQQYKQSVQAYALRQPSELDKRLLEVRQNQCNVRRKMWSILK